MQQIEEHIAVRANPETAIAMVNREVFRLIGQGLPVEDLQQEGLIGAWIAAQRFDPKRSKFSTYAPHIIRGALYIAIAEQGVLDPFVVSPYYREQVRFVRRVVRTFRSMHGHDPSAVEIQAALRQMKQKTARRMTLEQIERASKLGRRGHLRLDAPAYEESDTCTHGDLLADHRPTQLDHLLSREIYDEVVGIVRELDDRLLRLKPRVACYIRLRLGLEGEPLDMSTIARRYGVSHQAVNQVCAKYIPRLSQGLPKHFARVPLETIVELYREGRARKMYA